MSFNESIGNKIDALIQTLWEAIEEAKDEMKSKEIDPKQKEAWIRVINDAANVIQKLLKLRREEGVSEKTIFDLLDEAEKMAKKFKKKLRRSRRSKSPEQVLADLTKGQLIEIWWIDASQCRNVVKINNSTFATYRRLQGRFLCVKRDRRYGIKHLVTYTEEIDKGGKIIYNIDSTPVPIIVKVKIFKKLSKKGSYYQVPISLIKMKVAEKVTSVGEGAEKIVLAKTIKRGDDGKHEHQRNY